MLTREQRDKWAEELESGKWKQHHGALSNLDNERYCCLGVLAMHVLDEGYNYPLALHKRTRDRFVKYNDTDKLTFPEIAKHVRSLPVSDETQP